MGFCLHSASLAAASLTTRIVCIIICLQHSSEQERTSLLGPADAAGHRGIARKAAGVAQIDGHVAHVARADAEGKAASGVQQKNVSGGVAQGGTLGGPGATADRPLPGGLHRRHRHRVQREHHLSSKTLPYWVESFLNHSMLLWTSIFTSQQSRASLGW